MTHRIAVRLMENLVVILIVVFLAAALTPQFIELTHDADNSTAQFNLNEFRSQIAIYRAQHGGLNPTGADGAAVARQLTTRTNADGTYSGTPSLGPYLSAIPNNPAVVDPARQNLIKVVAVDPTTRDAAFGWIYNKANGNLFNAAEPTRD